MLLAVFPDNRSVLVLSHGGRLEEDAIHRPEHRLPTEEDLRALGVVIPKNLWRFADHRGEPVCGVFLERSRLATLVDKPVKSATGDRPQLIDRRTAPDTMDVEECTQVNRAFHLAHWDRNTLFCGTCASPMTRVPGEIAKQCPSCGTISYPRISPAVIVAVVREGKLLMAHSPRHPEGMHSVLAGFVEAGETLEYTVAREVQEETGITVRNIAYFASQPWPFPNSLMVGFTAEYAEGELTVSGEEIVNADWFGPAELPERIPDRYSIARRLIEWFVSEHGSVEDLQNLLNKR
ncbi:MAG: NAD(+) diphosphatase [Spirochaetaceae bacterium]|nr:MAG: NAD(+) diphosphatase [Spirochaetaceae bacterium]